MIKLQIRGTHGHNVNSKGFFIIIKNCNNSVIGCSLRLKPTGLMQLQSIEIKHCRSNRSRYGLKPSEQAKTSLFLWKMYYQEPTYLHTMTPLLSSPACDAELPSPLRRCLDVSFHLSACEAHDTIRTDVGWGCSLFQWNDMVNITLGRDFSVPLKDFRVLLH